MLINTKKSSCLRTDDRYNVPSKSITIQNQIIEWKQELKYLGVVLVSAKRFKINKQSVKYKFFRAVKCIW